MTTCPTPDLKRYRMMISDGLGLSTEGVTILLDHIDALQAELEKANADYRQARDAMYKVEDLRHQALAYAEILEQRLKNYEDLPEQRPTP